MTSSVWFLGLAAPSSHSLNTGEDTAAVAADVPRGRFAAAVAARPARWGVGR
ncbi:MAG TPA: hypothetical protein VFW64_20745 [Pseudonocardiaceae bacterium]|nr:hypothetical protein [Pseudonocardiaceae bacterium]